MSEITIYHNPACGTSRKVLALLQQCGATLQVVEYLKTPLDRQALTALLAALPISVREVLRQKGEWFETLGLDNPALTDAELIDAMLAHPILMNRPIVVTPLGANLCRPAETVLTLLTPAQQAACAVAQAAD